MEWGVGGGVGVEEGWAGGDFHRRPQRAQTRMPLAELVQAYSHHSNGEGEVALKRSIWFPGSLGTYGR